MTGVRAGSGGAGVRAGSGGSGVVGGPFSPTQLGFRNLWWVGGDESAALGHVQGNLIDPWPDEISDDNQVHGGGAGPTYVADHLDFNGMPVGYFDGGDILQVNFGEVFAQPLSIVWVSKAPLNGAFFFDGFDSSPRVVPVSQSPTRVDAGANDTTSIVSTADEWHLHMIYLNGASSVYHLDGVEEVFSPGTQGVQGFTWSKRYTSSPYLEQWTPLLGFYEGGDIRDDPLWNSFTEWVAATYTPPEASVSDDFARSDSLTLGSTPVGSLAWTSHLQPIGVVSGQAYMTPGAGNPSDNVATVDVGDANGIVEITLSSVSSVDGAGLVGRFVDNDNYWRLVYHEGAVEVTFEKKIAGSFTEISTFPINLNNGARLSLRFDGDQIDVFIDRSIIFSTTDSDLNDATRFGMVFFGDSDSNWRLNDFRYIPV